MIIIDNGIAIAFGITWLLAVCCMVKYLAGPWHEGAK